MEAVFAHDLKAFASSEKYNHIDENSGPSAKTPNTGEEEEQPFIDSLSIYRQDPEGDMKM
jgi:hypothetical protein